MSLNGIPEEIVQNIAAFLSDRDLASLRATCGHTAAAIDARPAHFWMYRFKEHFDLPRATFSLDDLKLRYQARRKALRSIGLFKQGTTEAEVLCVKHLLDIALDANPTIDNPYGIPHSKNFDCIDHVIKNSNLLRSIFERNACPSPKVAPMHSRKSKGTKPRALSQPFQYIATSLQSLQLLLSSRSLSFIIPSPPVWSFVDSQRAAYMDFESTPLFGGYGGIEVNTTWVLHIVNFFRYHMLRESEATLCPAFRDLSKVEGGVEMPQLWKKRLSNEDEEVPIGGSWKGSYAYLARREVNDLRRGKDLGGTIYEDHNVDLGHKAIQELEISFNGDTEGVVWPGAFENHLKGRTFLDEAAAKMIHEPRTPRSTRSSPAIAGPERPENLKSRYYNVKGWDDETFWASGWISQLPTQKNIPGFKRMVMMKYFVNTNGGIDYDALWAYEGIVLPGNQIIVGRWWSPEDPIVLGKIYSGPFILWNTDCATKYREIQDGQNIDQSAQDMIDLTHD